MLVKSYVAKTCLFVWCLVTASLCGAQDHAGKLQKIQLDDVYGKNTFSVRSGGDVRFSVDGDHLYRIGSDGDLLRFRLADGQLQDTVLAKKMLSPEKGRRLSFQGYLWDRSENLLLLHSDRKGIYRFSFTSIPWLYDRHRDTLYQVTDGPVSNVSFCPTGARLAYCRDNNIFRYEIATGEEVQITHSPVGGAVQNGVADWVYEETFGVVRAYKWSGDGRYIAYYTFDVSRVPVHGFPLYDADSSEGEHYSYRYYRPGEPLSGVSIQIHDLETGRTRTGIATPDEEYYYPRIYWSKDSKSLFVYKVPRNQKRLEIGRIDVRSGTYQTVLAESDERYIDRATFDAFYSFSDGRRFIYMSEKEGWRRLYLVDPDEKRETVLTPFSYDTDRLLGVDEQESLLYCSVAEDPRERQVLAIGLSKGTVKHVTADPGWNTVSFNGTFSHYLRTFSQLTEPPVTTVHTIGGRTVLTVEDNARLRDTLRHFEMSVPGFLQIPNREGVALNAWMLLPPDYQETEKYPVLFVNYGGPGSQRVTNKWGMVNFWYQYLAQQGIIVVCVDNTGTGYRGAAFKKAVYGRLGIREIEDQMDAARWLSVHHPAVDSTRIAYWGWSYGGFMASMAITYGAEVFSTAVAVAPVTHWKLYQSGYVERHMGRLQDNLAGYDASTPMAYIDRMKGNFLLIHGTADDNVPFRNSAVLSLELINAGKRFDQFYYPDKNHAISGTHTRFYLYRQMTDYLLGKLIGNEDDD